jgi:hypothetical protein
MKKIQVLTFLMVFVCMSLLICDRSMYPKDSKSQRIRAILTNYSLTDSISKQITRELITKIIENE